MIPTTLCQFERQFEPASQKPSAINLGYFLQLLKTEEEYYRDEKSKTKLMFTRLRKIFYDKYGWNTEIIRKAASVKCRYAVRLVDVEEEKDIRTKKRQGVKKYNSKNITVVDRKVREVVVRPGDWMRPNDAGEPAEIYENSNQEVILPDHWYCDMAHVLCGVDAFNNLEPVSPLPGFLFFLRKLLPCVEKNPDVATWLGDIASSTGEVLFRALNVVAQIRNINTSVEAKLALVHKYAPALEEDFLKGTNLKKRILLKNIQIPWDEKKAIFDDFAPAQDMLGNLISYVIFFHYNTRSNDGNRPTEIFEDFFFKNKQLQNRKYQLFAQAIGLSGYKDGMFANEAKWLRSYQKQLRDCTAMYVYTRSAKPWRYFITFKVWMNGYAKILDCPGCLDDFLNSLKTRINKEQRHYT